MTSRLAVTVGTTALTEPFDIEWNESLNRLGSFSFSMTTDDPQRSGVELGDVVTITKDDVDCFYGVVEQIRQTDADDAEVEVVTFSGRSSVAELERVVVYPPLWPVAGYGQTSGRDVQLQPWDRVRLFGWPDAQRAYYLAEDQSGMDNLTLMTGANRPEGWPDPTAWWAGDSAGADVLYMVGRVPDTDAVGRKVQYWAAAKDALELYHNGALVLRIDPAEADPSKCWTVVTEATPGKFQMFVAKVTRVFSARAEFAFAYADPASDSKLVIRTREPDNDWSMWSDPPTPPGTTPGEMLIDIIAEYEARRGESLGWTLTFTADDDSDGDPWPFIPIFPVQVGDSIVTVLERLAAGWVDWGVEVDGAARTLSMWNATPGRGAASGVTLEVGVNAVELTHEVTA